MAMTNDIDQQSLKEIGAVLEQLDHRQDALLRFDVRISKFVEGTTVPLQLEKERDDTQRQITELRQKVDAFLADTGLSEGELRSRVESIADTKGDTAEPRGDTADARDDTAEPKDNAADTKDDTEPERSPKLLWIAGGVAAVVVIWWVLTNIMQPGDVDLATVEPTLSPTAVAVVAAVPTSTPTTSPTPESEPIETTLNAAMKMGLPGIAPNLATNVTLVALPVCADEMESVAGFLTDSVADYEPTVTVVVHSPTESLPTDSEAMRSLVTEQDADLLVWCSGNGESRMFHLETLTQRAAPEVYAPATINVPFQPIDRLQRVVLGVTIYLRRDYVAAEPVLRTTLGLSSEADVQGYLQLLIGNAQTMRHDYVQATDTFNDLVKKQPDWAFAWHNLGVAEFNVAWGSQAYEDALRAFDQAQMVDPDFELSLVAIATIHRWWSDEVDHPDSYDLSIAACETTQQSENSRIRALGIMCSAQTQLFGYNLLDKPLPVIEDQSVLEQATTENWAGPLVILGLVEEAYWYASGDTTAQNRSQDYFRRYVIAAHDDVHLAESRFTYRDIIEYSLDVTTD